MSKPAMFRQPDLQDQDRPSEDLRREHREAAVYGKLGRTVRMNRKHSIGIKTSPEKKAQFDRLKRMTDWSYAVVFEKALDALEEKIKGERK